MVGFVARIRRTCAMAFRADGADELSRSRTAERRAKRLRNLHFLRPNVGVAIGKSGFEQQSNEATKMKPKTETGGRRQMADATGDPILEFGTRGRAVRAPGGMGKCCRVASQIQTKSK
jgi:hypothetical protein